MRINRPIPYCRATVTEDDGTIREETDDEFRAWLLSDAYLQLMHSSSEASELWVQRMLVDLFSAETSEGDGEVSDVEFWKARALAAEELLICFDQDSYLRGAAVAFGLMGMAEAIRENYGCQCQPVFSGTRRVGFSVVIVVVR